MISWFWNSSHNAFFPFFIIICYNLNKEIPFKVAKLAYYFHASKRTIHLKESKIDITKTPLQFKFYSVTSDLNDKFTTNNFQMFNKHCLLIRKANINQISPTQFWNSGLTRLKILFIQASVEQSWILRLHFSNNFMLKQD